MYVLSDIKSVIDLAIKRSYERLARKTNKEEYWTLARDKTLCVRVETTKKLKRKVKRGDQNDTWVAVSTQERSFYKIKQR